MAFYKSLTIFAKKIYCSIKQEPTDLPNKTELSCN